MSSHSIIRTSSPFLRGYVTFVTYVPQLLSVEYADEHTNNSANKHSSACSIPSSFQLRQGYAAYNLHIAAFKPYQFRKNLYPPTRLPRRRRRQCRIWRPVRSRHIRNRVGLCYCCRLRISCIRVRWRPPSRRRPFRMHPAFNIHSL